MKNNVADNSVTLPYRKRFSSLKAVANDGWLAHWEQLRTYFAPRLGRYLVASGADDDNKGYRKDGKIVNGTPIVARRNLSSGLLGNLTSPTAKWFRLAVKDDDLMDSPDVSQYLYDVREVILKAFAISNFYGTIHSNYDELSTFGTSCMLIEEDFDTIIRCRPFTIGEYYLGTNSKLIPDTLYRRYSMSVGSLVDEYGIENVTSVTKKLYDNEQFDVLVMVISCIQPRRGGKDAVVSDRYAYESVTFEEGNDESKFLRVKGYQEKPFMASRWNTVSGDVYGESPCMDALGDAMQLQKEETIKLKILSKMADPPLNAPPSMKDRVIDQRSGAVTYVDSTEPGSQGVRPVYETNISTQPMAEDIYKVEERIKKTLYNDLFMSVLDTTKRMTATEVESRREEKLALLSPAVNRMQSEVLEVAIERTFAICERMGLLPKTPEVLRENSIEIQYVSSLAQAQQAVETQSMEQVARFAGELAGAFPDVLDRLNSDELIEIYAEKYGIEPILIRSDSEVEKIRMERQQAMQAQQQQAQMAQTADTAKTMSDTDVGGNNALEELLSVM